MLGGEERGLGAWWVFRPGSHQLDRSDVFIGQLPQTSLTVLDHLLHCCMLLKRFPDLGLTERERCTGRTAGLCDITDIVEQMNMEKMATGSYCVFYTCGFITMKHHSCGI